MDTVGKQLYRVEAVDWDALIVQDKKPLMAITI